MRLDYFQSVATYLPKPAKMFIATNKGNITFVKLICFSEDDETFLSLIKRIKYNYGLTDV